MKIQLISAVTIAAVLALPTQADDAQIMTKAKKVLLGTASASANATAAKGITGVFVDQIATLGDSSEEQRRALATVHGNNPKKDLLELSPALTAQDFSQASKTILGREFQREKTKDNLLLAGMAGAPSTDEEIAKYAEAEIEKPSSGMFYGTMTWAAHLVRARGGNVVSISKILKAAREADTQTQVVFLLKELSYAPQPAVADYIATFAFSEERLPSPAPPMPGPLHAQYAISALTRMLANSPVLYKEDYSYTDTEIRLFREWLTSQKFWVFRNQ